MTIRWKEWQDNLCLIGAGNEETRWRLQKSLQHIEVMQNEF